MAPLVMVIEDEEALGLLLKYNLEKEGYEVILETRGNKALAEIEKYGPSVILLDWMLPEISGVEICKLVRSKPDIKNIPIIMLTAKGEEEDKIKGLTAGADDGLRPICDGPRKLRRPKSWCLKISGWIWWKKRSSAAKIIFTSDRPNSGC